MKERKNSIKRKIVAALAEMLKVKPYDRISITDMTNIAHVSRMAYYRNYASKDEILSKYMNDIALDIRGEMMKADGKNRLRIYFTAMFDILGRNSELGPALVNAQRGELIMQNFNRQLLEAFDRGGMSQIHQYRIGFIAGAFYNLFANWTVGGCSESPSDLVEIGCNMLAPELYLLG